MVPNPTDEMLMRTFYRNLQQHSDKAQALRQAILTTKQEFTNPVYWAVFTLIEESG